ncbi:hypothetical protein NP233_g2123 [Leucocoprinus birnbaumii]|uniref:Uncharacterized protein n=1 Tax=Leucocoprinus birnbaumii TaxID=56174 RepID=A0AAD5YU45_9AGAR|nr:hypothetical protein NP233_g2123 [Leucocoprinus birnbaumii]
MLLTPLHIGRGSYQSAHYNHIICIFLQDGRVDKPLKDALKRMSDSLASQINIALAHPSTAKSRPALEFMPSTTNSSRHPSTIRTRPSLEFTPFSTSEPSVVWQTIIAYVRAGQPPTEINAGLPIGSNGFHFNQIQQFIGATGYPWHGQDVYDIWTGQFKPIHTFASYPAGGIYNPFYITKPSDMAISDCLNLTSFLFKLHDDACLLDPLPLVVKFRTPHLPAVLCALDRARRRDGVMSEDEAMGAQEKIRRMGAHDDLTLNKVEEKGGLVQISS